ncbi:GAF domain-containing protein [candidate division WOR-3 bacterium]|nr:GAF domain-containing protein [candidate division WOR-3 bacterium]
MREIERIKKLNEVSKILLSENKLNKVLDAIVKNAAEFFSSDASSILLFDERKEYLRIEHSFNLSTKYLKVVKVRYDEEIAGKVLSSQKPAIIPNLVKLFKSMGDSFSVMWFKKEGLVSCVVAPIVLAKTSIGCLNLYYRRRYTFREKDLDALRVFCDFSAIAIHNASLIKKVENQLREKSALEHIGITLTSTLKLSDVLQTFVSAAVDLTNTEMGSIIVIDEKEKRIQKAYNYNKKRKRLESYESTARLNRGISGRILSKKRPVAIRDIRNEKDVNPTALKKKRRGVLAIPVMIKKKLIAILFVGSSKPRVFSKREVSQISVLTNQAAVAIENARLYAQIEQKIRNLSISYKISQTLISTLDLETLLLKILEELKKAFGYYNAAILLVDRESSKLIIKAAKGYPQKILKMKLRIGIDGITGHVAATGETYYAPDVSKDKYYIEGVPHVKSEVAIPLKIEKRTIGVLDVESKKNDAFSEWEIKLLSIIAAQIANAIEKSRLYEETKMLSLTDPLTELPNRRHFDIMIDTELRRSERYNRPLSLLLIDLDNFKSYNDRNGHLEGDKVLAEYAKFMKLSIRDIDFICRFGGDEFVVVLPETDESFAKAVAERIRKRVYNAREKLGITLSIGVASYPLDGEDKISLVMASDRACYIAKEEGGNCVRDLRDRK